MHHTDNEKCPTPATCKLHGCMTSCRDDTIKTDLPEGYKLYQPPYDGAAPTGLRPETPIYFWARGDGTKERWGTTHANASYLEYNTYAIPFGAAVEPQEASDDLSLPDEDAVRGDYPMFDGLLAYFPNALAEVSKVSKIGNDQHNPGQPMHWARNKSLDHENKIVRHLVDAGKFDGRGVRHTARLAWRALAMLQEELEKAEGLPPSRASRDRPW